MRGWMAPLGRSADGDRSRQEMCGGHGDCGRDGVVAMAIRHLGWPLEQMAAEISGASDTAQTQGETVLGTGRAAAETEGFQGANAG